MTGGPPASDGSRAVLFSAQAGSFTVKKNASALVKKLNYHRYNAYLDPNGAKSLFRVRVGTFASKDQTRALVERLKKDGFSAEVVAKDAG